MAPAPPRRRLHRGTEEEDAAQLKLGIFSPSFRVPQFSDHFEAGPEFDDADTLTTSEAKLLIDAVLTQRAKDTSEEIPLTESGPPSPSPF